MENKDAMVSNRRLRLKLLIKEKFNGSQAEFVTRTGQNQGEVSALLKTKSFGETKARKIEQECGLPIDWLDRMGFLTPWLLLSHRLLIRNKALLS
jgi:hypothetical protein